MKNLTPFKTIFKKELARVFSIWKQTLLPPVITSVLYFLIFWKFIWSKISDINWISYIEFIVPWLTLMWTITASYMNASFSFFSWKFQRSIEEILVSPVSNTAIIIAYISGGIARWIIIWIMTYVIAFFFTGIQINNYLVTILFLFFTSMLFALLGLFNWFFAKSFDDINIIPSFVLTPMIYLWWVFYSLEFLSPFWKIVSQFNPIFYMVNWLRYGMLWVSDVPVSYALMAIMIINIIMFIINLKLMRVWYWLKN